MFCAKAPATLMLFGEHGVLRGGYALLAAVNQHITVTLSPLNTRDVIIESALGYHETSLDYLDIVKPFTFVLSVLKGFQKDLKQGFHVGIEADFSSTLGFGSSAAVTIAIQKVVLDFLGHSLSQEAFLEKALEAVLRVQGQASGADLAASFCGGITLYRRQNFECKRVADRLPLVALYSGSKTPTPDVIRHVDALNLNVAVFEGQSSDVLNALKVIDDPKALGKAFDAANAYHQLFQTTTPALERCLDQLRAHESIFGAKISGSGLGDCVIGLGHALGQGIVPLHVAKQGLQTC